MVSLISERILRESRKVSEIGNVSTEATTEIVNWCIFCTSCSGFLHIIYGVSMQKEFGDVAYFEIK